MSIPALQAAQGRLLALLAMTGTSPARAATLRAELRQTAAQLAQARSTTTQH